MRCVEETCFASSIDPLKGFKWWWDDVVAAIEARFKARAARTGDDLPCSPLPPPVKEQAVEPLPYVRDASRFGGTVQNPEHPVVAPGDLVQRGGLAGAVGEVVGVRRRDDGRWVADVVTSDPRCKPECEWAFGSFHAWPVVSGHRAPMAREV